MNFATINSITLHYQLTGIVGGVPLVFLNSLGSDLCIWETVAPYFADQFSILRYDKRGHGLSDGPPGPYLLRDHADDLAGLLQHLGIASPILVGVSIGGMIALQFALSQPVRALVLCDTGARIGTIDSWNSRIETIQQQGLAAIKDVVLARWFTPRFVSEHQAEMRGYSNMLMRTPAEGYMATCVGLRDGDLRDAVGQITAPALVLCGDQDIATPPALGRELVELLPNASFSLIPGSAHIPSIEQPELLAEKIAQFLRDQT